ncbi:MAG: hypothetical protein ACI4S4_00655 [Candidatus Ornithospirochaeta sp.]
MALFLALSSAFSLYSFSISMDLMSVDFLFRDGMRIDAECRFEGKDYDIIIPIRYGKSDDNFLQLIETGAVVAVHPIDDLGFVVEASLLKTGWMWGTAATEEQVFFESEGSIGWDAEVGKMVLRPRLTYRVSSSVGGDAEEALKRISQFNGLRLSLSVGMMFDKKKNPSELAETKV